jgi:hypothetical protein
VSEEAAPARRVGRSRNRFASLWTYSAVAAAYLAVSVVEWWNVWTSHPTSVTTCGCGDASLFLWFLEWPAYAIAHAHDPFFSAAMFHPSGINLLSNTSTLLVGTVLAPVTWLFGPVATLNVASTLGPVLTGLSMFWLLGRWVSWKPAAFVGGLIFGFSPFVFVSFAGGHLMTGYLVLVPLIVGCLDELLVAQNWSPKRAGVTLGLLLAAQFFVSTEVLVILGICVAVGVLVLVVAAAIRSQEQLKARLPAAIRGVAIAVVVSVVLLAYPVWFALDGPQHLSGLVWPTLDTGTGGIMLHNLWGISFQTGLRNVMQVVGGYEGPALPQEEYLGLGLLTVVGAGLVVWWRERRLWFLAALGLVGVAFSLGTTSNYWDLWRVLKHVPVIQNIIPGRFQIVTTFCAAAAVAIVVDRANCAMVRVSTRPKGDGVGDQSRARSWAVRIASEIVALSIASVAVIPLASAIAPNVPFTTQSSEVPLWFTEVGAHLPPRQVVFTIPAPFTLYESAVAWQAIEGLRFSIAGGAGPGGVPTRAGNEEAGLEVLSSASFSLVGAPQPTPTNVTAVRRAFAGWGVTIAVLPDPASLPRYDRGTSPAAAIGLLTLAIGRPPGFVDDAWVWPDVESPGARLAINEAAFDRCTLGYYSGGAGLAAVGSCVSAAASPVT